MLEIASRITPQVFYESLLIFTEKQCIRICCMSLPDCITCYLGMQQCPQWFHFIGHLCGINFKSGRILGQEGVNTEICEQVNSFLQCIKYTGSHLSQDHFTFFMQVFLYLMNKDKTINFQKLAGIAIAGQL